MKKNWIFALLLTTLLSSCGKSPRDQESQTVGEPATEKMVSSDETAEVAEAEGASDTKDVVASGAAAPLPIPAAEVVAPSRLLIYHADLRLKVPNLPRATASLDSLVRRNDAFLSAATETRVDGQWQQLMTIRVRPARFQALMSALGGVGTVEEKKLTTDDVTAQHADISARLATKREVEKRYVGLLARAQKISEILEIEAKIGEVREEIESTQSRLKTLNDEVSYSTISLACYQIIPQSVPDAPVMSFASRVVDSFYTGWMLITGLFIGLVAIWPLWILIPAAWWVLRRWRQRKPATPKA